MAKTASRAGLAAAFDSLFPSASASAPTPLATPALGYVSEGESFGGPNVDSHDASYDLQRSVALSSAKRFLSNVVVRKDSFSPEGVLAAKAQLMESTPKDVQGIMETALAGWPDLPHYEEDVVGLATPCTLYPC